MPPLWICLSALFVLVLLPACSERNDTDTAVRTPSTTAPGPAAGDGSRVPRAPRAGREARPLVGQPEGSSAPDAEAARPPHVPAALLGLWAADPNACARAGDSSRLAISDAELRFHESEGRVIAVDVDGDVTRIALNLTGEGETRGAIYNFKLTDAGLVLVDTESGFARQRCH